jgi:hypothetical protein
MITPAVMFIVGGGATKMNRLQELGQFLFGTTEPPELAVRAAGQQMPHWHLDRERREWVAHGLVDDETAEQAA